MTDTCSFEERQSLMGEFQQGATQGPRESGGAVAVQWIVTVVLAARVVHDGEGLDDSRAGPGGFGHAQAVLTFEPSCRRG